MKSSQKGAHHVLGSKAMRKKHVYYVKENQRVFFTISIFVFLVASLLFASILTPFTVLLDGGLFYVLVLMYGVFVGAILYFMLHDLVQLNKSMRRSLFVFIPVIFIFSLFVFMTAGIKFSYMVNMNYIPNNFYVVIFAFIGFIISLLLFEARK